MPDRQPRHIRLEGQPNFRDLGGYAGAGGRRVAYGRIYRSGDLTALSDSDVDRLEELGLRTVVDLRATEEVERDGEDRVPAGVRIVHLPIDTIRVFGAALGDGDVADKGTDAYLATYRALIDDWTERFAELIGEIETATSHPLVFHCTHGKDRAGLAAVSVLAALGVAWPAIERDYLFSNACREELDESEIGALRLSIASRYGVAAETIEVDWLRQLFFVQPQYLAVARRRIDERHGDIAGYLRDGLGLSAERLALLRGELLVDEEGE
jgi:protein-tyrosine phosphatase